MYLGITSNINWTGFFCGKQKNGCMIEYTFKYSDGWYRLEKYNCELNQHEIDYLKGFIEMACNPIILEIQELK